MKEFKYVIKDEQGIHARPASALAKQVSTCKSKVMLTKDGKTVEAGRILSVMGLAAKKGQEIVLTVDGEDEDEAIEKLSTFLKENL